MSNKTQVYCNPDNSYNVKLLKKLWKDLSFATKRLKEKEVEEQLKVQELISIGKNRTAIQMIKLGKLRIEIGHFKNVIKSINYSINHISDNLLIC